MRPWHQPWFAAQSKFLDPLAGRLCGTAGANAGCARRAPNPSKLPPWPQPQTGRSAETDTDPPCSSHPPRRGPAHPSTVAYSDHACAAGAPADRAACWITVSPRATALLPLAPRAPLPQPVLIASRGRAGFPPACLPQRRQAAALHTLPRLPTAPSTSRSVCRAPACWRFRRATARPETHRPRPARPKTTEVLHDPTRYSVHGPAQRLPRASIFLRGRAMRWRGGGRPR